MDPLTLIDDSALKVDLHWPNVRGTLISIKELVT
jgi:hypothetical protein